MFAMVQSKTIKVLVVDDSGFFLRRVAEIINADPRLEVIGTASNGKEGVEKALALKPDVITMDYEMPVMDGVTAVRMIMSQHPIPVLMFSSLTYEGARITFDALEAGAVDFLAKQFDAIAASQATLHKTLTDRIVSVAASNQKRVVSAAPSNKPLVASSKTVGSPSDKAASPSHISSTTSTSTSTSNRASERASVKASDASATSRLSAHEQSDQLKALGPGKSLHHVSVVVIGTSTGGPAALQTIFKQLPGDFSKPIVIVQHMPATFTKAFAERLDRLSPLTVKEAEEGDRLQAGHVYVAPGGMQLMIDKRAGGSIHIHESDARISYRPSVDIALASAAKHFGRNALAIILTGMGSDGKEGAKLLKQTGGAVWAQDEASCVIYGMPMAVIDAGIVSKVLPISDVASNIYHEAN